MVEPMEQRSGCGIDGIGIVIGTGVGAAVGAVVGAGIEAEEYDGVGEKGGSVETVKTF